MSAFVWIKCTLPGCDNETIVQKVNLSAKSKTGTKGLYCSREHANVAQHLWWKRIANNGQS